MKYIAKMEHNTNRLNFPLMVDNHLKVTPRPHSIYFDSYTLPNNKANKTASMKTKSHAGATKTDIETSLGSIYYTIHNSLQNKNMHRRLKQSISQPHIEIEKAEPPKADDNNKNNKNNSSKNSKTNNNNNNNTNNTSNTNNISNKNNYIKTKSKNNSISQNKGSRYNSSIYNKFKFNNYTNNNNKINYRPNTLNYKPITTKHKTFKTTTTPTTGTVETKRNKNSTVTSMSHEVNHQFAQRPTSIALATIKCERKHRQALAHTIHPYELHQREAEIMHRKRMLQEMLQEHEILQTNRRAIRQEIQSLKVYINEIREKLDRSLLKLDEKRTVYSLSGKRNRSTGGSTATSKPAQNNNSCSAAAAAKAHTNSQPLTGLRINRRLKK